MQVVEIRITAKELFNAKMRGVKSHRDLIQAKFLSKGYIVVKFEELLYLQDEKVTEPTFVIQGDTRTSLVRR